MKKMKRIFGVLALTAVMAVGAMQIFTPLVATAGGGGVKPCQVNVSACNLDRLQFSKYGCNWECPDPYCYQLDQWMTIDCCQAAIC